jgi:hypothetical protein
VRFYTLLRVASAIFQSAQKDILILRILGCHIVSASTLINRPEVYLHNFTHVR